MSPTRTGLLIGALTAAVTIAVVLGIVVATGGNDSSPPSQVVAAPSVAPTLAATLAPTSTPVPSPAPAPTQPPPAPTEAPPPPPPQIRTCAEIRVDPAYRSEEERQFFIQNCVATPRPQSTSAAPQANAPGPPSQAGPTEEEQAYTRRASQVNLEYTAKLSQYWNTPSQGGLNDLYDLGAIALNHANAISAIQPVPSRFRGAHDTLIGTLLAFRDHILRINTVGSQSQFLTWLATYERLADTLNVNLVAWQRAVGVQVVSLGGLR